MEQTIKRIFILLRAFVRASEIKTSRNFIDFLADRITQAATKSTLLATMELRFIEHPPCSPIKK